jgi:hypothetical protein
VSFFEPPPPPPDAEDHQQPEWMGPPENALPSSFPLALTLARTQKVGIAAQGGLAYPNGSSVESRSSHTPAIHSTGGIAGGELVDEAFALRRAVQ